MRIEWIAKARIATEFFIIRLIRSKAILLIAISLRMIMIGRSGERINFRGEPRQALNYLSADSMELIGISEGQGGVDAFWIYIYGALAGKSFRARIFHLSRTGRLADTDRIVPNGRPEWSLNKLDKFIWSTATCHKLSFSSRYRHEMRKFLRQPVVRYFYEHLRANMSTTISKFVFWIRSHQCHHVDRSFPCHVCVLSRHMHRSSRQKFLVFSFLSA